MLTITIVKLIFEALLLTKLHKTNKSIMKKIYSLLVTMMIASAVVGQSQRLCLLEEYTQASCPPCAALNPALNAILASNTSKVVSIKYQTNWPGVDPMNSQTQTWVGPRVSYYGVTGVPNICFDGNVLQKASPATLTQPVIDNRYAVTSPFDLDVVHQFNSTFDSVAITIQITASQAASGTLVLHTALVEEEILFCTPPGSNGEKDFYGVMRQMLPSASGTTLANSWTTGTSQTVTFNVAVPSYVYDKKQLAVVAFIQNNANKEVLQTGLSSPLALPLDASIKVCGANEITCTAAYTPSVELTNFGTNDVTSVDFSYTIAGNTSTFNWTGLLTTGASTTVTFPAVTLTGAASTFNASITAVNGTTDLVSGNNTFSKSITYNSSAPVALPATQDFVATAFPPANWFRTNGGGTATWARNAVGASGANGSAKMDFYSSAVGDVDDLLTAKFDLATANAPTLTFKLAKASYTGYTDQLDVDITTDCGATWTNVWSQSDPQLTTAGAFTSGAWTATSGSTTQWRQETISLAAFAGQPEVSARFRAVSGFGNNLYLDDINLSTAVGVGENQLEEQISLFPTPSAGTVFVNLSAIKDNTVRVSILDVTGKTIETYVTEKSNQHEVNMKGLANGTYMLQIDADGQRISKKVILNK